MLNLKNTLDGYLKNVEVIGNTIQDTNNLANIRSVGDKVEGQELYTIGIVSRGKNLFDGILYEGSVKIEDGTVVANNNRVTTSFIKIIPNTTYVRNTLSGITNTWVAFYDNSKKFLGQSFCVTSGSFTSPPGAYYTRYSFDKTNLSSNETEKLLIKNNAQLEKGTQVTPYEPYQGDKLEILSPVQLEKVGNVADKVIYKDGVWGVEKNVETVVVNGSETLNSYNTGNTNTLSFYIQPYNIASYSCISTMPVKNIPNADTEGVFTHSNGIIYISLSKDKASTIDEFRAWIKKNNITIKYLTTQPQFIPLPHDQQVKLRTFAGQTNVSFLTEIAGQIKAQVPKSLGATVNTHTEQIKDLHNSLDRVKKLEETTVSTVETENSFTTVDSTSNGYFEDVKLEGKTLVNLYKNKNKLFNSSYIYGDKEALDFSLLNTHTTYTLVVFGSDKVVSTSMCNQSATQSLYIRQPGNVTKFTTPSNFDSFTDDIRVYAYSSSSNGFVQGEEQKIKFMLLKGDHTNNPPEFFEGLLSVGQDVEEVSVESTNKNLWVYEFEEGTLNTSNGHLVGSSVGFRSVYIPIKSNSFVISNLDATGKSFIAFYDSDKNYISRTGGQNQNAIFTTNIPNGACYFILTQYAFASETERNNSKNSIKPQLEYGGLKTEYQPAKHNKKHILYYNPTTETWEKPILREWDSIEKHSDGKYYYHKRSGEVVFNGSESWIYEPSYTTDEVYGCYIMNNGTYTPIMAINGSVVVDTLLNRGHSFVIEGVSCNKTTISLRITKNRLSTQDVVGFKAWLQANPTTVVYQLAQEEVYECTNIDLMTYNKETNYIINSGVISPKSLLKVHNNISNVVKILQEKVSLLENTFIAGLKSVLSGDMYSLATILYPEDFEQNDNTEQDIMVIPEQ